MSNIGIIPVRYHSTRLPNKTFRLCGGKTLLERTVEVAKNSKLDSIIVVSSYPAVEDWCKRENVEFLNRPRGLEGDRVSILDTINWMNDECCFRCIENQMLLQITNPTRTVMDINKAIDLLKVKTVNSICSVVDVGEYHPNRMYKPTMGLGLEPLSRNNQWIRTQSLPRLFLRDGGIYYWKTCAFKEFKGLTLLPERVLRIEIPIERSFRIDTERDLFLADQFLTNPHNLLS